MDLELSEDQQAILQAVGALLEQHAGVERAVELAASGSYDAELDSALLESGFRDVALAPETGPLEAVLLSEAVARSGGVISFAADVLVAPALLGKAVEGPVALAAAPVRGPIRFGAHARTLLVVDADEARIATLEPGDAKRVRSSFGYPMGRVAAGALKRAESLGPGSARTLRSWWRVALAAETVGAMQGCLDVTVAYLKERRQFGRPIGSFQAVQHRLAECAVMLEGARWLTYLAAWHGAPAEAAATAAAYAAASAGRVFGETHQLSGAIGFTREHDLHVWSMRLQALRLELGGVAGHRDAVVETRWS